MTKIIIHYTKVFIGNGQVYKSPSQAIYFICAAITFGTIGRESCFGSGSLSSKDKSDNISSTLPPLTTSEQQHAAQYGAPLIEVLFSVLLFMLCFDVLISIGHRILHTHLYFWHRQHHAQRGSIPAGGW